MAEGDKERSPKGSILKPSQAPFLYSAIKTWSEKCAPKGKLEKSILFILETPIRCTFMAVDISLIFFSNLHKFV